MVLQEFGLAPGGAQTFAIDAQAFEAAWTSGAAESVDRGELEEAAATRLDGPLAELLACVGECKEFEDFQNRVKGW